MNARQTKIMLAQYKKAVSSPNEFVRFALSSENETNVWYVLLSGFPGDENEFAGGEYLCKMIATDKFPFEPPQFYLMTENGVYGVDVKVCISIGEFHKDQARAALGMSGFANQLVSGLIGWRDIGSGISLYKTSVAEKKKLAANSRAFNHKKYPEIMAKIESAYADYSKGWDLTKIPLPMQIQLGLVRQEA